MSWVRDFTTYHGRLRRSQFLWRHFVLCFVGTFGAMALMFPLTLLVDLSMAMAVAMAVVMPPLLYADLSLVVRRFHDVGLSGWWVFAAMAPIAVLFALPLGVMPLEWQILVIAPVNLAYFAILLVVPGSKGENRYGSPNARPD